MRNYAKRTIENHVKAFITAKAAIAAAKAAAEAEKVWLLNMLEDDSPSDKEVQKLFHMITGLNIRVVKDSTTTNGKKLKELNPDLWEMVQDVKRGYITVV